MNWSGLADAIIKVWNQTDLGLWGFWGVLTIGLMILAYRFLSKPPWNRPK